MMRPFSLLTECILGNYRLGLQWVSNAILLDSTDSEDVLIALNESGNINDAVFQFLWDNGPHDSAGLPLFHNVMCYHSTTLISRRGPHNGDIVRCHLLKLNLSMRWTWLIWTWRGTWLYKSQANCMVLFDKFEARKIITIGRIFKYYLE